jgi:ribosomal protein S18 acetylase RimI-like enzyme
MMPAEITLRPVSESDLPFLFEIYASTREAELALTPWTAEQKQLFLNMQFQGQINGYREMHPQAVHEIIAAAGRPVGRLYLSRLPDCHHILDITIAPESRNAGIGSLVLRTILEEADLSGKPVTIYVESFNPSLRLFQRLGFQIASQDSFQLLLERPPVRMQIQEAGAL